MAVARTRWTLAHSQFKFGAKVDDGWFRAKVQRREGQY